MSTARNGNRKCTCGHYFANHDMKHVPAHKGEFASFPAKGFKWRGHCLAKGCACKFAQTAAEKRENDRMVAKVARQFGTALGALLKTEGGEE